MKVTAPPTPAARSLQEICQAARQGLITGPELVAVLADFDVFTTATIVKTPGSAR